MIKHTCHGSDHLRRVSHVVENGKYTQRFIISRHWTGTLLLVVRP